MACVATVGSSDTSLLRRSVAGREQRLLRPRIAEQREGTGKLVILVHRALPGSRVTQHEARNAPIELTVQHERGARIVLRLDRHPGIREPATQDRKSTRLNSSHMSISYAVF